MTEKEMRTEIERLKAENAKLAEANAKNAPKIGMKVSEKGAVSVYGLGKWPVTLYRTQWEALVGDPDKEDDLGRVNDIKAFIKANSDKLATKNKE